MHPDEWVYLLLFWCSSARRNSRSTSIGSSSSHQHQRIASPSSTTTNTTTTSSSSSSSSSATSTTSTPSVQDDIHWCQQILGKVSRSFAIVIQQLPDPLRIDVLVFYLVLRALDTIEDEIDNNQDVDPRTALRTKTKLLKSFSKVALGSTTTTFATILPRRGNHHRKQPSLFSSSSSWSLDHVGNGDERRLLQEFPRVQNVYRSWITPESQIIIADIAARMGAGMAETIMQQQQPHGSKSSSQSSSSNQGIPNIAQYNTYCHYVAGLVGEGLSRLFAQSGLEDPYLAEERFLSNQMGLFLQKTNIIRDYLEDIVEGRTFWPQSIWKEHVKNHGTTTDADDDLRYFSTHHNNNLTLEENAARLNNRMACLNDMIADALELVPACLAYLSELQCPAIFRFCSIPQVMAMATLEKMYGNDDVFSGVVKIRKALSCRLMLRTNTLDTVHEIFHDMAKSIESKARRLQRSNVLKETSVVPLLDTCDVICAITEAGHRRQNRARLLPMLFVTGLVVCQDRPHILLALVAAGIINFYFGPFYFHGNPNNHLAWSAIPRLWKEILGKDR